MLGGAPNVGSIEGEPDGGGVGRGSGTPDVASRRVAGNTPSQPNLGGLLVVLAGCNRATRVRAVLGALQGALRRGAEVLYVDGGSSDRSLECARRSGASVRVEPRFDGSRLEALGAASHVRFIAGVSLRAEVDAHSLQVLLDAARAERGRALQVPALVGLDGRGIEPVVPRRVQVRVSMRTATPPVWLTHREFARTALGGTWDGTLELQSAATALLLEAPMLPEPVSSAPLPPSELGGMGG